MRKILIVAYACEPFKGSEQGIGWGWTTELAKNNIVHVITRLNNRKIIEGNPSEWKNLNITFHYYDARFFLKFKKRGKGLYTYYVIWQLGVLDKVRELKREIKFDYIFQPTLGNLWLPTFLHFTGLPLIWGPLGGGEGVPRAFLKSLPAKDRLIQSFRYKLKYLAFINPFLLFLLYKTRVLLVRTPLTLNSIPYWFRHKARIVMDGAMPDSIFLYKKGSDNDDKIRLIVTSRLIPFKNIESAVEAVLRVPERYRIEFTIVGEGPCKQRIEDILNSTGSTHVIKLAGALPRKKALSLLCESDIYIFPSLREGASWSLMEAMAVGLPVICLNWTGNAVITDDSSAVRLEVTNPDQFCRDMTKAIEMLAQNPGLRKQIGESARKRIREKFNWEEKGKFMETLFSELEADKGKNGKGY